MQIVSLVDHVDCIPALAVGVRDGIRNWLLTAK